MDRGTNQLCRDLTVALKPSVAMINSLPCENSINDIVGNYNIYTRLWRELW